MVPRLDQERSPGAPGKAPFPWGWGAAGRPAGNRQHVGSRTGATIESPAGQGPQAGTRGQRERRGRAGPSTAPTAAAPQLRRAVAPPGGERGRHLTPVLGGASLSCWRAMQSGICISAGRAGRGRRRGEDCVSRGAPRCPGDPLVPAADGAAGPGRAGPGGHDVAAGRARHREQENGNGGAGVASAWRGAPGEPARGGGDLAQAAAPGAAGSGSQQRHRALPFMESWHPKRFPGVSRFPFPAHSALSARLSQELRVGAQSSRAELEFWVKPGRIN